MYLGFSSLIQTRLVGTPLKLIFHTLQVDKIDLSNPQASTCHVSVLLIMLTHSGSKFHILLVIKLTILLRKKVHLQSQKNGHNLKLITSNQYRKLKKVNLKNLNQVLPVLNHPKVKIAAIIHLFRQMEMKLKKHLSHPLKLNVKIHSHEEKES